MKHRYKRLHSNNFLKVSSEAISSMDYDEQNKILEIEFTGSKIYQYCDIDKKIWKQFLSIVGKNESLGTYVNSEFKQMVEDKELGFYELESE